MPTIIDTPVRVQAAGTPPKQIEEYAGLAATGSADFSVARMVSPEGWSEPGQRPEFQEISVVLKGTLRVHHDGGSVDVKAGQAIVLLPGEWVRYSTPVQGGAEYISVCVPAFSPNTVHRDEDD